jgi:hypothetical protein
MTQLAGVAAVAAWTGASVLVLSEGRRALAAGLAVFGIGLAVAVAFTAPVPAAVLAAGSLAAAALRLRDGRPGWRMLPPGSTPRLILCLGVGVIGGFAATSLIAGPGPGPARAAAALGGVMTAARLLSTTHRDAALTSASALCLVMGGVAALIGTDTALTVAGFAALGAVAVSGITAAEEADA